MRYDLVVVGAGFFGLTVAERIASSGRRVLVVERRAHLGGNCWSELDSETGVEVHSYGTHIFHTKNKSVWDYVTRFSAFNNYAHSVFVRHGSKTYAMPVNLTTINALYGKDLSPSEARDLIQREAQSSGIAAPSNLEEQAVSQVGRRLYGAFIENYTKKQWQVDPRQLPGEIIKRLPVRFNRSIRYFDDPYEGIPLCGYGELLRRIGSHKNIEISLATEWKECESEFVGHVRVVFTGPIDEYFGWKFGRLGWRSLRFEKENISTPDYQGCAVMNYADLEDPFTRIHEFKHLHPERPCGGRTSICREYPMACEEGCEPYYPINRASDRELLERYLYEASRLPKVWLGGRLGSYRYMDMDVAVAHALNLADEVGASYLRQ